MDILHARWTAVRICICLGLTCGMLLSWRLWLSSGRHFPVLPCFGLGALPAPLDWALFLGALGLSCAAIWSKWNRWVICALIGVIVLLGILDQMRWQPWAYQYLLALIPMAFVRGSTDKKGIITSLDVVRLILIAIYVWSGIHKFGIQFQRTYRADVVVEWLSESPGWWNELLFFSGRLVPWIEIAIGLFLLFPRIRLAGIWMAIGMHAFILMSLGPFGTATNTVIWPWNLVMPFLVLALFWKYRGIALRELWSVKRLRAIVIGVGILVVVMPGRSAVKKWDQYLSFHLYSGHHQRMNLVAHQTKVDQMDVFLTEMMKPAETLSGESTSHQTLSIPQWAMSELNVPMPSADRLQLMVAKYLTLELDLTDESYFYRDYPQLVEERGFDIQPPSKVRELKEFSAFNNGQMVQGD